VGACKKGIDRCGIGARIEGKEIETMTTGLHGLIVGFFAGMIFLILVSVWSPPQVPCRCGSAPVTSLIVLPDMVVRS
jgi:hypothetical protein